MNCCDDYGQCQQGHGCPARTTPAQCLKAGFCQSRAECHCEKTLEEDAQPWLSFNCFLNEVIAFLLGMLYALGLVWLGRVL